MEMSRFDQCVLSVSRSNKMDNPELGDEGIGIYSLAPEFAQNAEESKYQLQTETLETLTEKAKAMVQHPKHRGDRLD